MDAACLLAKFGFGGNLFCVCFTSSLAPGLSKVGDSIFDELKIIWQ
jgi:hypothetical protein